MNIAVLIFGMLFIPINIFGKSTDPRLHSINKQTVSNTGLDKYKMDLVKEKKNSSIDNNVKLTQYSKKKPKRKVINDHAFTNAIPSEHTFPYFPRNQHVIPFNDVQYPTSERLESYEDPVRARESNKHEHQIKSVKVKIKHHHHHHHHNHIKEVIKTVPKPYPVEKIVHIPFERIVEKIVHVPKILNVTLEKVVHVPVEKIVEKIIHIPKPVHIPKPYLIEKMVEKVVHVPKPFPVLRTVPYPVEIKVAAQEKLPIPFKMKAERKLIGYFNTKEPIKLKTFGQKNNNQTDDFKLNIEVENASNKKQYPVILPSDYIHNKISQYTQATDPTKTENLSKIARPEYKYFGLLKNSIPIEQSTSESETIHVKLLRANGNFRFHVVDTPINNSDTVDNLEFQNRNSTHHFNGIPLSVPIQLVPLQPKKYQSSIGFELDASDSS